MLNLERNFDIATPGDNITDYCDQLRNIIDDLPSDSITCYTDGSRTDTGCGAGYIITTNNNNTTIHETSYKLPDYCTVFQAELTAIREAFNYLANTTNKHNIIIWTDSLSSIEAVTTLSIRSRTTRSCYEALNTLRTNNKLELRWIAAHTGLWGNESRRAG
jgi:ribonuclease HI